ncbi:MAG: hypothetical protein Q9160_006719 [Pyrenula sp. 1 TL-2023]
MSLRIAPSSAHPTSTSNTAPQKLSSSQSSTTHPSAPSAPGLPDTLRSPPHHQPPSTPSTSNTLSSTHPLEARLSAWTATQQALKHNLLARTYGLAEPVRREMELKIVREGDAGVLNGEGMRMGMGIGGGTAGLHEDILMGRDCEIGWEDVFRGQDGANFEEGN